MKATQELTDNSVCGKIAQRIATGVMVIAVGVGLLVGSANNAQANDIHDHDPQIQAESAHVERSAFGVPIPDELDVSLTDQGSHFKPVGGGLIGMIAQNLSKHVFDKTYVGTVNIDNKTNDDHLNVLKLIGSSSEHMKANGIDTSDYTSVLNSVQSMSNSITHQVQSDEIKVSRENAESDILKIKNGTRLDNLMDNLAHIDKNSSQMTKNIHAATHIEIEKELYAQVRDMPIIKAIAEYNHIDVRSAINQIKNGTEPSLNELAISSANDQRQSFDYFTKSINDRLASGTQLTGEQVGNLDKQKIVIHELAHAYDQANHVSGEFMGAKSSVDMESFADLSSISIASGIFAAQNNLNLDDVQEASMRLSMFKRSFSMEGDSHIGASMAIAYSLDHQLQMNEISKMAYQYAQRDKFDFNHDMVGLYEHVADVFNTPEYQAELKVVRDNVDNHGIDLKLAERMMNNLSALHGRLGLFDKIDYPASKHGLPEMELSDYIDHRPDVSNFR